MKSNLTRGNGVRGGELEMFEMRPWMYLNDGTRRSPVIFNVLDRERKVVVRIDWHRAAWRVQFTADYSYAAARFKSPDEALASIA